MEHSMSTLITADFHLNDQPRDEYRHVFVASLPKLVKKHNVDRLLILGDLTDEKDRHSSRLVNRISNYLYALTQTCKEVVILRGNHDYLTPDWPFFAFTSRMPRVIWYGQPTATTDAELFLPHTTNYKKDWTEIKMDEHDCIFAHNTFKGARNEAGIELGGIPFERLAKALLVVSGDVHVPQTFGCLTYVGAPYHINFGDTFIPRVLLLENGKLKSIPTTGVQKRLIEGTFPFKGATYREGDIVKIRAHITMADCATWFELRGKILYWCEERELIVHTVQPIVEYPLGPKAKEMERYQYKSDAQLLHEYAQRHGIDSRTLRVGMELLEEIP
jgi:predicted phosphodiesterase